MWDVVVKQEQGSVVLVASCPDELGIVRGVCDFVYKLGAGIIQSDQFSEEETVQFFMRCEFRGFTRDLPDLVSLRTQFFPIAEQFNMNWAMHDSAVKPRVMLAVSKLGHCLNDLLYRWEDGELPMDLVGVVSNHPDLQSKVEWYGLPYYHLPVNKETKPQQERSILQHMADANADLLVLARYMQILSPTMCEKLAGRAINIHHSFLPSFKGAKPYSQAYERGVKIIGATAHYVTTDLDEGPIIEQDIHRVGHSIGSMEMARIGREIESSVLARAVKWHCEHRILLSDKKTIVFN